jgi:hypothetical protein
MFVSGMARQDYTWERIRHWKLVCALQDLHLTVGEIKAKLLPARPSPADQGTFYDHLYRTGPEYSSPAK